MATTPQPIAAKAAADKQPPSDKRTYPVLSPILRDGKSYVVGDEIELTPSDAEELAECVGKPAKS